jgi:hypothetical protein
MSEKNVQALVLLVDQCSYAWCHIASIEQIEQDILIMRQQIDKGQASWFWELMIDLAKSAQNKKKSLQQLQLV